MAIVPPVIGTVLGFLLQHRDPPPPPKRYSWEDESEPDETDNTPTPPTIH